MAEHGAGSLPMIDPAFNYQEQELNERLKRLYPAVYEEETPLPRSWSPKDKYSYIGLSQNNLRVHYKGQRAASSPMNKHIYKSRSSQLYNLSLLLRRECVCMEVSVSVSVSNTHTLYNRMISLCVLSTLVESSLSCLFCPVTLLCFTNERRNFQIGDSELAHPNSRSCYHQHTEIYLHHNQHGFIKSL